MRFYPTIFLGSFLLFLIQPLVGKHLLPWFGGTPSVWTTCLLFFQLALVAGYGLAHLVATRLTMRSQRRAVLGAGLAAIGLLVCQWAWMWGGPLLASKDHRPLDSQWPVLRVLWLLGIGVGLPLMLLTAQSPLVQAWFHRKWPTRSPYRLYALSNLGSLLALLGYPFLLEPSLPLRPQAILWTCLFAAFFAALVACAWWTPAEPRAEPPPSDEPSRGRRPAAAALVGWASLAACGTGLLLSVTTQMCQEISVVPFLWVLPLALYLLSFVMTFDNERVYRRRVFGPALWLFTALALVVLFRGAVTDAWIQIAVWSTYLFVACMVCHAELVRRKPDPAHLTSFYLMISAGGAVGGVLVGLLAPVLLMANFELHLCMLAAALVFLWPLRRGPWAEHKLVRVAGLLSVLALAGLLGLNAVSLVSRAREMRRSFFGALRVEELYPNDAQRHRFLMWHGPVAHGAQYVHDRKVPAAAFGATTGLGLAISNHPKRIANQPMRIGVIGMGVGTIAAYGLSGDVIRMYEIDPNVIDWARGRGGYFSYLADSQAAIEVIEGDGRLSLDRELAAGGGQRFDLLVLDAFSGAAPPVHLLTVEAFDLYRAHLAADGVLAVHLSNAHLNLASLVLAQARKLGLASVLIYNDTDGTTWSSDWMLLSQEAEFLERPVMVANRVPKTRPALVDPWTDEFSDLFRILIY